ncbi:hypothetical protein P3S68_005936 [Capsicum galapagoense]
MVLQDSKGDRIHASIGKYDIKFFKNKMEELGLYRINNFVVTSNSKKLKTTTHKHKLIFIKTTSVEKITDPSFPMDILNLRPFDQFTIHYIVDDTKLFDVVGQVVPYEAVQTFKQGDNTFKLASWISNWRKRTPHVWKLTIDRGASHRKSRSRLILFLGKCILLS